MADNSEVAECGRLRLFPLWLLLPGVAAAACGLPDSPSRTTVLTLERFASDVSFTSFSGYTTAATFVWRSRDEWQRAWDDINRRITPVPQLPDVDFSRDMVVGVALGSRPSSGYDVLLTGATETDGVVTVEATERKPGTSCVTLTVVTYPLDIARVPMRTGRVTFHSTTMTYECR